MSDLLQEIVVGAVVLLSAVYAFRVLAPFGWRVALARRLVGMALSFLAGLVALRWLSRWLEQGRWHFFGAYCLVAAVVVLVVG